jgi:hypothetical protein
MLFIFGKRHARIGRYIDNDHICYPCKAYDREIHIYRSYFHFCLIPVFPIGPRRFEVHCRICGDETKSENIIAQYDARTKTPVYFYSAWILLAIFAICWFFWNKNNQKQKTDLVSNPAVGDVYTIKKIKNTETSYFFVKITNINGDSIAVIQNDLYYSDFVNHLDKDDYFVKDDTIIYKRKNLKQMLANDEIFSVDRNYDKDASFNQIK